MTGARTGAAQSRQSAACIAAADGKRQRLAAIAERIERGVMNRGIDDIATLFDPSKTWTAFAPQAQWNSELLYNFGASTGQPRPATARTDDRGTDDDEGARHRAIQSD